MTLVQSVKKTAKSAGLVLMTGAFCIFAPPQPASAATPVSSCGAVLSVPGEYILTNDLNNCPSTAVTITASDVHFNLDGHTIDGIGNGSGIAVGAVGVTCVATSNVHINNGTVTQFDDGIQLCRATDAHVNNVTATQNDNGFHLIDSDDNHLNGNTATDNDDGIDLDSDSNDNLINGNDASGNGGDVIEFNHSDGNEIIGNRASDNGDDGIDLDDSDHNTVRANKTNDNGDHGIEVNDGANDNLLQANSSTGNGTVDMVDFNPACDANTWKANHFNTANQPCIQ